MADINLKEIDLDAGEGAVGIFEDDQSRFYVVEVARFETIEDAQEYASGIMAENEIALSMATIH